MADKAKKFIATIKASREESDRNAQGLTAQHSELVRRQRVKFMRTAYLNHLDVFIRSVFPSRNDLQVSTKAFFVNKLKTDLYIPGIHRTPETSFAELTSTDTELGKKFVCNETRIDKLMEKLSKGEFLSAQEKAAGKSHAVAAPAPSATNRSFSTSRSTGTNTSTTSTSTSGDNGALNESIRTLEEERDGLCATLHALEQNSLKPLTDDQKSEVLAYCFSTASQSTNSQTLAILENLQKVCGVDGREMQQSELSSYRFPMVVVEPLAEILLARGLEISGNNNDDSAVFVVPNVVKSIQDLRDQISIYNAQIAEFKLHQS